MLRFSGGRVNELPQAVRELNTIQFATQRNDDRLVSPDHLCSEFGDFESQIMTSATADSVAEWRPSLRSSEGSRKDSRVASAPLLPLGYEEGDVESEACFGAMKSKKATDPEFVRLHLG